MNIWYYIVFFILFSCNQNNCANAKVDANIKELEEYNARFFDGDYTGTVINYYNDTNSVAEQKVFYEKGKIVKYESYYKNGSPKIIKPVKCQSSHGKLVYYYPNNKIAYDLEYNLGKKEGIGHSYFKSGTVQKIVNYTNDLMNGRQLELSEKEDTIVEEFYNMGKLKSRFEPMKELEKILIEEADSLGLYKMGQLMKYKRKNKPSKELQNKLDNAIKAFNHREQADLKEKNQ